MTALLRRFYAACDIASQDGKYAVRLDGRVARSPGGNPLVAPSEAIARLVADEWAGQGEQIDFMAMPATRLLHTALDGIPGRRADVAAGIAEFAAADTLCYFAEGPSGLVRRQDEQWRPLLAWAGARHGLEFREATGITHVAQPAATLAAVEAAAIACDDCALAGLAFGAALFASAILVLVVRDGRLGGAEAFAVSRLDERFQEERWGVDAAAAAARERLSAEAAMLGRWFGQSG